MRRKWASAVVPMEIRREVSVSAYISLKDLQLSIIEVPVACCACLLLLAEFEQLRIYFTGTRSFANLAVKVMAQQSDKTLRLVQPTFYGRRLLLGRRRCPRQGSRNHWSLPSPSVQILYLFSTRKTARSIGKRATYCEAPAAWL